MKAVSNSSPLIFATKVSGLLNLLEKKFEKVIVPEEVFEEIVATVLKSEKPEIQENAAKIKQFFDKNFFQKKKIKNRKLVKELTKNLGLGEAAAIVLALEIGTKNVLMDERKATVIAKIHGLIPTPITALVIEAKHKKWLDKKRAKEMLDSLLINNYRVDVKTYQEITKLLD